MAYAATVSVERKKISGRRQWIVTVAESDQATDSEYTVGDVAGDQLPVLCTLRSYQATLTEGTGATINPALGNTAAFVADTQSHIATNSTTAAHIHDNAAVRLYLPAGELFVRSTTDADDDDNVIATVMVIVEGHQD